MRFTAKLEPLEQLEFLEPVLRRGGKSAIDNDDLASDESIVQDQAQHAVGNVLFRAAALEGRVSRAASH